MIATIVVVSTLAGAGLVSAAASPAAGSDLGGAATHSPGARVSASPAITQYLNGTFFSANTTFADTSASTWPCSSDVWANYSYPFGIDNTSYQNCYGGAQSPSVLPLANGNLGVAYSVLTTGRTACTTDGSQVVSRIGFQISPDGGKTYGAAKYLGNQTCNDLQAIEPSFAVSSNGDVDGAFVQDNFTSRNGTSYSGIPLPPEYGNRTNDSLGFVRSLDNGTSFGAVRTIAAAGGADIARPQLATFGATIYVVYDRLNNWTNLTLPVGFPYPAPDPISVQIVYSSDDGATWHGPFDLPGLNASQGYTAESPSIAVSSAGKVAVAYATNRGCFAGGGSFCPSYGDSIVVATSGTNGTSWSTPSVVAASVGETQCQGYDNDTGPNYWYSCYAYQFQDAPETTVAWSATNSTGLYVAWSGMYNWTDTTYGYPSNELGQGGIGSAASQTAGVSWTNATVIAPEPPGSYDYDYFYDPVLAVHGAVVSLAYTWENLTYCNGACPFSYAFSYWLTNSTDGLAWGTPSLLALDPVPGYEIFDFWGGYNDALAFDAGSPVVAFSQPVLPVQGYQEITITVGSIPDYISWYNDTGQSDLTVAYVSSGATTNVTVGQHGLPAGSHWSFSLGSVSVATNATTVRVGDVPRNTSLLLDPGGTTARGGYRISFGLTTLPQFLEFRGPANESVNYTEEYGLELWLQPTSIQNFYFNFVVNGSFFSFNAFGGPATPSPAFPWYLPAGTVVPFGGGTMGSSLPISYFNGSGNGSSTVAGNSTQLTMDGPINETLWAGAIGSYSVTFVPIGLTPSDTYEFTFDGTVHSAAGTTNVTVPNVLTGAYGLSAIHANSTRSGWEYFGTAALGSVVIVPDETQVGLNFSAAYVNLSASPGSVAFHATGLTPGDLWRMTFNGTTLSSATPWINVSARPGTYGVSAFPIPASANDTTSYAPSGVGPTVAVTPGGTYPINFTRAFRVEALAGQGGAITGAGTHWLAPGATENFTATPRTDYRFLGWSGSGPGSYTGPLANATIHVGGAIVEAATFEALPLARFNLTFDALGLPNGTWWTVEVNGSGYAANQSDLVVPDLNPCSAGSIGSYPVSVPYAYPNGSEGTRFVPTGPPTPQCTSGTTNVSVPFAAEYLVTPISTPGGVASVVVSGPAASTPSWVPANGVVDLQATPSSSNFTFVRWVGSGPGNYSGPVAEEQIFPAGPVTETAFFAPVVVPPPPTYNVSFHATVSFGAGTSWGLEVDQVNYSSTTDWINLTGLAGGPHNVVVRTALSPDGRTEYTPTSPTTSVDPPRTVDVPVPFGIAYWVSISSTGGGTLLGASNGFVPAGHAIELNASPLSGDLFVGWAGTGSGSYTGPLAAQGIIVGGPITELATFAPVPATSSSSPSSVLDSPAVLAGLAVVGLVVGLAAGVMAFRRRAPPTEPSPPKEASP